MLESLVNLNSFVADENMDDIVDMICQIYQFVFNKNMILIANIHTRTNVPLLQMI